MALTVTLWQWRLDVTPMRLAELAGHLSGEERARADRFVTPLHRDRFIAGRGRLREILARYVDEAPQALGFAYNDHGRPSLCESAAPHFNLSHTGGLAILAVCDDMPVGIDIERMRPIEVEVARRYFSDAEVRALETLAGEAWLQGFYRCWTRKEAVIKALGLGLSMPLESFDVTLAPEAPARLTRIADDAPEAWSLTHLDVAPDVVGAVALRTAGRAVKIEVAGDAIDDTPERGQGRAP